MNPLTFNDGIQRALDQYPARGDVARFDGWQRAPLFDYVTTYDRERQLLRGGDIEPLEEMHMPFEMFRLAVIETAVPWKDGEHELGHGTYRTNVVVARRDGELTLAAEIKELWDRADKPPDKRVPLPLCLLITNLRRDPDGKEKDAYFYRVAVWSHGSWMPVSQHHYGLNQLVSGVLGSVASFIIDANLPTTHLVTVRPKRDGKSVEWTRARMHYTLITHGHPANQRMLAEGARVRTDRDEEIKRMAHDRRGHWRTYRHERYTYARGQRRWVKKAWVGPKEWMDERGRQIYRILEPVTNERTLDFNISTVHT